MKELRAGGLVLATVIGLIWASGALALEATTEPTTTDETTRTTTTQSSAEAAPNPWAETPRTRYLERRALWLRLVARKLSRLTQHERPHVARTRADFGSLLRYRLWLRDAWRVRAERARYRANHPPHRSEWRCIHRFEGSLDRPELAVLRRAADGSRLPARVRPRAACGGRAQQTTGPPTSRCGSPSAPCARDAASIPGRSPLAAVASSPEGGELRTGP